MTTQSTGPHNASQSNEPSERESLSSKPQNSTIMSTNGPDLINSLLPIEVLENVFRKLLFCRALTGDLILWRTPGASFHSTVAFLRVCRRWFILGMPILWAHLTLATNSRQRTFMQSGFLHNEFPQNKHVFGNIKSLNLGIDHVVDNTESPSIHSILPTMSNLRFLFLAVRNEFGVDVTGVVRQVLSSIPASCHSVCIDNDQVSYGNVDQKLIEEIQSILSHLRKLTLRGGISFLEQFLKILTNHCQFTGQRYDRLQELALLTKPTRFFAVFGTRRSMLDRYAYRLHRHVQSSVFPTLQRCFIINSNIQIDSYNLNTAAVEPINHLIRVVGFYDLIKGTIVCYDAFRLTRNANDLNTPELLRCDADLEIQNHRYSFDYYNPQYVIFHDNGVPNDRTHRPEGNVEVLHTIADGIGLSLLLQDLCRCGWVTADVNYRSYKVRVPRSYFVSEQGQESGLEVKGHRSVTRRICTQGATSEIAAWKAVEDKGIRKPRYYTLRET